MATTLKLEAYTTAYVTPGSVGCWWGLDPNAKAKLGRGPRGEDRKAGTLKLAEWARLTPPSPAALAAGASKKDGATCV